MALTRDEADCIIATIRAYKTIIAKTEESAGEHGRLIMAVGSKFDGESRFETALRYIMERETYSEFGACSEKPKAAE